MVARSTSYVIIWITVCVVLIDLIWAHQLQETAQYTPTTFNKNGRKLKKDAYDEECELPLPLANGKFYPSLRRCHPENDSPACRMVPGTPVPRNWVIFYYCNPGFTLNTTKPLSVCLRGQWEPSLPACEVGEFECFNHDQCPDNKTCIVGRCADSCDGLCGPNTYCDISFHRPLCSCKKGFVGNPFKGCIVADPISTKLLITQRKQVAVLDMSISTITSILRYPEQGSIGNSPSIAYHHDKKYIFYSSPNQIYRDEVVGSLTRVGSPKALITTGLTVKLAVDWVHDKLYWMSHTDKNIEVSDLDGFNRTTLVSGGLIFNWELQNIVVDPYAGYLFFVSNDTLFRMNLDGTNMSRLHLDDDGIRGVYVLTLDTHHRQLYYTSWDLETVKPYITVVDYEGRNAKDLPIGDRYYEIQAVAIFRNTMYYCHFKRGQSDELWSLDLASSPPTPVLIQTIDKGILGVTVYHSDVQKESGDGTTGVKSCQVKSNLLNSIIWHTTCLE